MSVNYNFIMQTIGSIVQTYASILAVGGAFFLFMIEGNKREREFLVDRIDRWIDRAEEMHYLDAIPTDSVHLRRVIYELGAENYAHTIKTSKKLNIIPDGADIPIENMHPYNELYNLAKKYERMKPKNAVWSYKHFSSLFGVSTISLIFSIVVMGMMSIWWEFIEQYVIYLFTVILLYSIVGFVILIKFISDIVKMEEE